MMDGPAPAGTASAPFLQIGRVLGPHGLRGEVKVDVSTDFPERFAQGATIWIEGEDLPSRVLSARKHKDVLLVLLEGYDDRTRADLLRERRLLVPRDHAMPLPEGEYYGDELVGLHVITDNGIELGALVDIWWTAANEVYVVEGPLGEVLLPAIADVIQEVDLHNQKIVVKLLPGLVPELDDIYFGGAANPS